MDAGEGPIGAPTAPVPVTVGPSGTTSVADAVPVFVTVSVTAIDWPTFTRAGWVAMVAVSATWAGASTVKAPASSPEVPKGP